MRVCKKKIANLKKAVVVHFISCNHHFFSPTWISLAKSASVYSHAPKGLTQNLSLYFL